MTSYKTSSVVTNTPSPHFDSLAQPAALRFKDFYIVPPLSDAQKRYKTP